MSIAVVSYTSYPVSIVFAYNNPLIVAASISLFLYFGKHQFISKKTNLFASTVVASLFLQDVILANWIYPIIESIGRTYSLGHISIIIILFTIAFLVLAFIIEYPRKKISGKIIDRISPYIQSFYKKLVCSGIRA